MNTRLKHFLDAENISQSQFADTINVGRASISHVLSGRNNPSYDFVKAIMAAYPDLNIEWLMLGKGKMYKSAATSLFEDEELYTSPQSTAPESNIPVQQDVQIETAQVSTDINTLKEIPQTIVKQRNVSKIIVMFDDGTFQEM